MGKKRTKKQKKFVEINIKTLISELKFGDNNAFKLIIEEFGDKVYYLAYKITNSHNDAEEVFQEVFLTIYQKIHLLKDFKALPAWIKRVTINIANMKIRNNKRNERLLNRFETETNHTNTHNSLSISENTINEILSIEVKDVVNKAISELPPKYKSVIVLNHLKNFSLQKTSDILNISVPAVKSRLHRARKELKNKLDLYFIENA